MCSAVISYFNDPSQTDYLIIYRTLVARLAELLACWTQAQKGLESYRSRNAVG